MKKRIISLMLVLTMMVGILPVSAINTDSKYYVVDEMTEAEAFAAGFDVYMAWYNYHDAYGDVVTNPIEAIYADETSAFNQLYALIYPEGADSDHGRSVLDEAKRWLEDHYDGIDQFSEVESEIIMSLLLACVLYTGISEANSSNDITETDDLTDDIIINGWNIANFDFLNKLISEGVNYNQTAPLLEFLSDHADEFDFGKYSIGVLSKIAMECIQTEAAKKEAIATAAKYDTIKSAAASDIDIMREFETYGHIGEYVKVYTEAYDELWLTGESSFEESLLKNNINHLDLYIDLVSTTLSVGLSAVAASEGISVALGIGASAFAAALIGFEAFNILEAAWKFSGDALFGQTAMKTADVTLFYLGWIRDMFYGGYRDAYINFGYYPTQENAEKINAYSRLMYRIFAASEMYASQLNDSYANSGIFNEDWMHNIPGGIDPALTAIAENQSKENMHRRSKYLENAGNAYATFCENSVYPIELNLLGGTYSIVKELGLGDNVVKWGKIKSIETTIPEGIPVRTGYQFLGWSTNSNATVADPDYAPGSIYSKDADLTLYAVWVKANTITLNANNGESSPTTITFLTGNSVTLPKPTRTGYSFQGWAESATGAVKYQPGKSYTFPEGNVTLYAVWEAGKFDVIFHANEGKFSDNTDSKTMQKVYSQKFTVNPGTLTRDGYTFSGEWTENADGSGHHIYQGTTLTDIDGKSGLHTRHFYAKWIKTKTHAEFRYDYNNCSDYNDSTLQLNNGVLSVKLVDPPQNILDKFATAGKKFVKWMYIKPDGSTEYYKSGDTLTITNPGEPRECVYAIWEVASSGALLSVIPDKSSYLPGDTVTLTITADNSGYFTVDASNNSGFKIKCADGSTASSGVFVEKSSASTSNTLKCYDNGSAYTVKVNIPNNCSDGSYTVDIVASNGTYGVNGTETSAVSETITIKVDTYEEEADSYTLLYHPNGGYGTVPDAERFKDGDRIKISAPSGLNRDGYTFSHWTTDEDGDGKEYKAGKTYRFTDDVILYAQWKVDPDADVSKELEMSLWTANSHGKTGVHWYKPGDIIGLGVDIDNSNHFYVSVKEHSGWTLRHANGTTDVQSVFYEKNSPNYDGNQTYTNGSGTIVSIQIPENCRDGEYTIFVTGADSVVDSSTGSSNGKKLTVGITITVRKSEKPDEVLLNKSEITIHKGDRKRLTAAIVPEFVIDDGYDIKWKSSNTSVATVDKTGEWVNVKSVGVGTATITATCNGISASCKVTVVKCSYTVKDPQNEYLVSPATCATQATYYYVCECGDEGTSTYKYGDVKAHSYSTWTTVKQPTATSAGVEQRTCSGCQNTEERSIPATGAHTTHTPGTVWHSDSEKHWHVCSVDGCNIKLNEDAHTFGDLSVETPATETNTGIGYRTCTCGYSKSEIIPIIKYPVFIVQDAVVTSGDTVQITIALQNSPGISGLYLQLLHSDGFVFSGTISYQNSLDCAVMTDDSSPNSIYIFMISNSAYSDCDLITLEYKILDNVPNGKYNFAIAYYEACDENDDIDCRAQNGVITIDRHTHTFSTWSHHSNSQHKRTCSCGEVEYADHMWDSGVVTTKPTCAKEGVKTFTCLTCELIKTELIAKLLPDVEKDGDVDIADAKLILKYIIGWDVVVDEEAIDVNGDGKVTVVDAIELMLTLVAKSTP